MEQFEKVCKGLECCVLRDPDDHRRCGECPYNPHAISNEPCANGLKFNALALILQQQERIKELEATQTARVMTLEEVKKHYSLPPVVLDDLCWQEDYLQDIEPLYFDFPVEDSFAVHWRGYQSVRKYLEDWQASYGQKWRCWTQRPTDEQREAAKWE